MVFKPILFFPIVDVSFVRATNRKPIGSFPSASSPKTAFSFLNARNGDLLTLEMFRPVDKENDLQTIILMFPLPGFSNRDGFFGTVGLS